MDYAMLAPHVGSWALRDERIGNSSMRGGAINWSNLGSRISSALGTAGRWAYNAGNRFYHSNTFQQFKQGLKDSGIVESAGNLVGQTLGALTDIGRQKLQQDLERLRRRALGEDGPAASAGELQALIAALQQQANTPVPLPETSASAEPAAPLVPTTRPIPEMVTEVRGDKPQTLEYIHPSTRPTTLEMPVPAETSAPPAKRRRKRARPSGNWRSRLDSLSGSGVRTSMRRLCY
nr:capsid protein precursor pVI [Tawny frogmouth aviadenovirus A]